MKRIVLYYLPAITYFRDVNCVRELVKKQTIVTVSYLDRPSYILCCRDEQAPLLALRPQLQADPSPAPRSIRGR